MVKNFYAQGVEDEKNNTTRRDNYHINLKVLEEEIKNANTKSEEK